MPVPEQQLLPPEAPATHGRHPQGSFVGAEPPAHPGPAHLQQNSPGARRAAERAAGAQGWHAGTAGAQAERRSSGVGAGGLPGLNNL